MSHSRNKNKVQAAAEIFHIYDSHIEITKDVAIAWVVARVEGEDIEASGSARRHPDDKANPRVASLLAYSRAVENLARKLNKRAQGAVKHAEDMVEIKKTQRSRKPIVSAKGMANYDLRTNA